MLGPLLGDHLGKPIIDGVQLFMSERNDSAAMEIVSGT